jgi:hypothetical protein
MDIQFYPVTTIWWNGKNILVLNTENYTLELMIIVNNCNQNATTRSQLDELFSGTQFQLQ